MPMSIGCYFILYAVPLCGAEQDFQSCLQSSLHCHNDLRSDRQCVVLCSPASPHHLSAIKTQHINYVVYQQGVTHRRIILSLHCYFLPVPTSHSGVFSWWMTTLTCWLRAKATIASLPANVPGWDRLDTRWKEARFIETFFLNFLWCL